MPTPHEFSSSLLIDDFDTFVHYLNSKPNLPLTTAGDLKAPDLWAINDRVNYKAPDRLSTAGVSSSDRYSQPFVSCSIWENDYPRSEQ